MNTEKMMQFDVLGMEELNSISGGIGYRWFCSDGKSSNWHWRKHTAETNANNYMSRHPGVTCTVDYA